MKSYRSSFIYTIAIISMAAASGAAYSQTPPSDPDSTDGAYLQIHESSKQLREIDYSFKVSLYGDAIQRVRASSGKTRFDSLVPEKRNDVMAMGTTTDAFDGELYQTFGSTVRQLAISRVALAQGSGVIGPCITPLEACYPWVRSDPNESIWSCMHKDSSWANLTPSKDTGEFSVNGMPCVRLQFTRSNGVTVHVYFSPDLQWFPVKTEVFDSTPAKSLSSVTIASNFIEVPNGDKGSTWIPLLVECTSRAGPAGPLSNSIRYEILENSVTIGSIIDSEVFTIPHSLASYIYDMDSSEVFAPGSSIRAPAKKR